MQIKKFIIAFSIIISIMVHPAHTSYQKPFILVLDPSGDVKHAGRRIDDVFERGITLQCAEKIKESIEAHCNNCTVFITRLPGDVVYELQNAAFSNRLNADLFISINFYHTQDARPTISLYTFSYADTFMYHSDDLAFHPYDTAHIKQKTITSHMLNTITNGLHKDIYQTLFTVSAPSALPLKQIIGVCAPSIVIDAGLKDKNGWNYYIEPLAHAIINAIR